MKKALNKKQTKFCHYILRDPDNATKAAILAGYSKKTARFIACENLTKPNIKKYIADNATNYALVLGLTTMRVLWELKKIAFASHAQLNSGWYTREEWEDIPDILKDAIEIIDSKMEHSISDDGTKATEHLQLRIKMHGKLKALELIAKILGSFSPEKMEIKTIEGINIDGLSGEAAGQILQIIEADELKTNEHKD